MERKISFEQARAQYPHRFTMEHVPDWARKPMPNGRHYAPHFRSDREWYDNSVFPGEPGLHRNTRHCQTNNMTWPLSQTLDAPYQRGAK